MNTGKSRRLTGLFPYLGEELTRCFRGCSAQLVTSIKGTIENLINKPGGNGDQNQLGTHLLPFVPLIVRQPAGQSTIELFGDTRRQWLAPCQILLDAGRQRLATAPVIPMTMNDFKGGCAIDIRAMCPIVTA